MTKSILVYTGYLRGMLNGSGKNAPALSNSEAKSHENTNFGMRVGLVKFVEKLLLSCDVIIVKSQL